MSRDNYVEQVGGTHYQAEEEHWDLMEEFDIAYLEATSTKYVTRWPKKGSALLDLQKAVSYLDKILAMGRNEVRRRVPWDRLTAFMDANGLGRRSRKVLILVLVNGNQDDLRQARSVLLSMAAHVKDDLSYEAIDA